MAYVRKVVTASGATAVQVCEKVGGQQKVLAHIGSAHDEVSLALLMDKARNWLQVPGQDELDLEVWCVKVFGQFGYATWVTCVVCCSHACAGVWYPSAEWGRIRL